MNLVQELAAERESIRSDARALIGRITSEARLAVEQSGTCFPVVAALDGSAPEFYHPRWVNAYEKAKAFSEIHDELKTRAISATVFAMPVEITPPGGSPESAVMIVAHTTDWKEMHILPFRITAKHEIKWARPIIQNSFKSNLLDYPYGTEV